LPRRPVSVETLRIRQENNWPEYLLLDEATRDLSQKFHCQQLRSYGSYLTKGLLKLFLGFCLTEPRRLPHHRTRQALEERMRVAIRKSLTMGKSLSVGILLSVVAWASLAASQRSLAPAPAQTKPAPQSATPADRGDVERGKYLVENVAMCGECHTPRNSRGDLKYDAWLQGASTWIRPVAPIQNWADAAPPLAGMPSLTDDQFYTILEKGMGPEGEVLRPPMHIYHMHHEDAKAIVAYLKTVPPGTR
jgi:mono/diheme cytochrome c family protein